MDTIENILKLMLNDIKDQFIKSDISIKSDITIKETLNVFVFCRNMKNDYFNITNNKISKKQLILIDEILSMEPLVERYLKLKTFW